MRVGVDIDNTMNDISQSIARYLDPVVGMDTESLLREHLWISTAVGWTEEEVESFFDRHAEKIHKYADMKDEYTAHMLKGLFLRSINLVVITNRNPDRTGYDIKTCTHDWLRDNKILEYFSEVHFTPSCKQEYCVRIDMPLDAMIEDNPERAITFLEAGVPVVLFDYPYNRFIEHKLVHRVTNWWEAFQAVVKIQDEMGKIR